MILIKILKKVLFGKQKKKQENRKVKFSDDLTRLDENGELPFGWYYANKEFTSSVEETNKALLDQYIKRSRENTSARVKATQYYLEFLTKGQKICKQKGECFEYWFETIATQKEIDELSEKLEQYKEELINT